jgi:hypothetical protein
MRTLLAVIAAFTMITLPCVADESADMTKAANGFYGVYKTFHPSDGIPNAKDRAKYAPFSSLAMNKILADADAAEGKFAQANKDSPPLIEGDLFTSNFEGASSVSVGACTGDGKTGKCAINLTYDPGKTGNPKDLPLHWTDTAYLVNEGGWKVDDIAYGGTWDFGNRGKLRETLRMTIADAGN